MMSAFISRYFRTATAALVLMIAIGVAAEAQAQRDYGFYLVSANDTVVGLAPGHTMRLSVFNPTAVAVGGHVKVFSGTGQVLLSAQNTYIPAGEFQSFDINYHDLGQMPGESGTGRRQIRTEMTINFTGLESDARRFRPTYELVNTNSGETIIIGLLLPAIQKVR